MSFKQDDDRLVFKPEASATKPRDGMTVLVDRWWVHVEGRGLLFYRQSAKSRHLIPQCNADLNCAEAARSRLYPWATLKFFPAVYISIDAEGRMS